MAVQYLELELLCSTIDSHDNLTVFNRVDETNLVSIYLKHLKIQRTITIIVMSR
jgi:hypothetical protein